MPEWYADWLTPWYQCVSRKCQRADRRSYIPLKVDYSELHDLMAYFAGDLDGSGAHPQAAEAIAERGRQFVDEHVRRPWPASGSDGRSVENRGHAVVRRGPRRLTSCRRSYMFRLSLEYARALLRPDSDNAAMDYVSKAL